MEILAPSRGNRCLSVGNRISIFYLEQQDAKNLVDRDLHNARRDRRYHGNVSFRAHHDCSQRRGIRAEVFRAEDKKISSQPQRAASWCNEQLRCLSRRICSCEHVARSTPCPGVNILNVRQPRAEVAT